MIRAIVFDLWNTLAHNTGAPDPMEILAEALGIRAQEDWRHRLERGMMLAPAAGMAGALRQLEAREGLAIVDPVARRSVLERWSHAGEDAALYPDVLPALDALRDRYRLGLCSNTQSFGLEFLARSGLWARIEASALSFELGALKPRSEMFTTVCTRLGQSPENVLMVGDSLPCDIRGARSAGLQALRIARPGAALAEPAVDGDPVIEDLDGLVDAVRRFTPSA